MKIFHKIIYLLNIVGVYSLSCFTSFDIQQQGLTSYKGNVYNLHNYNMHPAGSDILIQAYGKTLEEFFDQPIYSFHLDSKQTDIDLQNILVGTLQETCNKNQPTPIIYTKNQLHIYHNNILSMFWNLDIENKINIFVSIQRYFPSQWVGIGLKDGNIIVGYNNQNSSFGFIDVFEKNIQNNFLLTNKYENYLIENKNLFYTTNDFYMNFTYTLSPTLLLDQIKFEYFIGKDFDSFQKNQYEYFDYFYLNLISGKLVDPHVENKQYEYYLYNKFILHLSSIISYIVFFVIFIFCLFITHTNKYDFFNKYKKIPYLGFYSIGQIIFLSIYFSWYFGFLIYSLSDIQEILLRTGTWISLIMAINLLPITRNSLWVIFFDLSYEKLTQFHKIIGFSCLLAVSIKFLAVFYTFSAKFLVSTQYGSNTNPLFGTISTIFIFFLTILSLPYIRKTNFEVFYYSHRTLTLLIFIFSSIHHINYLFYLLPSLILYLIDIILRIYNTKKAIYSKIQTFGKEEYGTSCLFVSVTLLHPVKTKAGSYFFICHNGISFLEYHPLSLITQDHDTLIFCVKDLGNNSWSHKLKLYDIKHMNDKQKLQNRNLFLQGPYGHFNINYEKDKFERIILIAGGIGITPIISVMEDLHNLKVREENKLSKLKKVVLIWIVPHHSLISPFVKKLIELDDNLFEFNLFTSNKFNNEVQTQKSLNIPLFIKIEKPKLSSLINFHVLDNNGTSENTAVMCCGPNALTTDVIATCAKLNVIVSAEQF
jgi:NAD(P)H-flavin reductase